MDVTITRAGIECLDRLAPLWLALHAHHQHVDPDHAYQPDDASWTARRALYERIFAHDGAFVMLAETGGELIGYTLVHLQPGPDDTWVTGERLAEVESLSVLPGHRNEGVGSALLDAVDAELARLGIHDLFIAVLAANEEALRFYRRRGLRPLVTRLGRLAAES